MLSSAAATTEAPPADAELTGMGTLPFAWYRGAVPDLELFADGAPLETDEVASAPDVSFCPTAVCPSKPRYNFRCRAHAQPRFLVLACLFAPQLHDLIADFYLPNSLSLVMRASCCPVALSICCPSPRSQVPFVRCVYLKFGTAGRVPSVCIPVWLGSDTFSHK